MVAQKAADRRRSCSSPCRILGVGAAKEGGTGKSNDGAAAASGEAPGTADEGAQPAKAKGAKKKAPARQLTPHEQELQYIRTQLLRLIGSAVEASGIPSERMKNAANQRWEAFLRSSSRGARA